jgi:hypothetical protein
MRDPAAIFIGVGAVIFGILMVLGRSFYASFVLMLLRGIGNGSLATKGMGRICRIGMAAFGGAVVVIGVVVAAGGL